MRTNACPRCGCSLQEPYRYREGDQKCGHCKLEVEWIQVWIPIEKKEEYVQS
jgi:hypothetical protein